MRPVRAAAAVLIYFEQSVQRTAGQSLSPHGYTGYRYDTTVRSFNKAQGRRRQTHMDVNSHSVLVCVECLSTMDRGDTMTI